MAKKKPSIFATSSDWHFGHLPYDQLNHEFFGEGGFIEKIIDDIEFAKENDLDFLGLFITGDIFHALLKVNDPSAQLANEVIQTLINIVIVNAKSHIVIIRGTFGHDYNQLNIFKDMMPNFKNKLFVFNTLDSVTINGYDILCVPEEYMKNQTEYYAERFSKTYDIGLFHGFCKYNCFNKNDVERRMPDMPIFDEDELDTICRVSIFGHDHHFWNKGNVYSNGSYSRNAHGEQEAKGYIRHYIDEDDHEAEFVENELALKFDTYILDEVVKPEKDDLISFKKAYNTIIKLYNKCDFLKIKVPTHIVKKQPELIEMLKDHFVKYGKRIIIEGHGIMLKDGQFIEIKTSEEVEENEEETIESSESSKYDFLNGNDLNLYEKIQKFIEVKHGNSVDAELTLDFIQNAISPDSSL